MNSEFWFLASGQFEFTQVTMCDAIRTADWRVNFLARWIAFCKVIKIFLDLSESKSQVTVRTTMTNNKMRSLDTRFIWGKVEVWLDWPRLTKFQVKHLMSRNFDNFLYYNFFFVPKWSYYFNYCCHFGRIYLHLKYHVDISNNVELILWNSTYLEPFCSDVTTWPRREK
jgi:hypothetical protein